MSGEVDDDDDGDGEEKSEFVCTTRHTKFQPTTAQWICPKCSTPPPDGLVVDDGESFDCEMLHETDYLLCYKCKYETNGKSFAAALQKKENMVTCPCCKGVGLVRRQAKQAGRRRSADGK